eukprot:jgi/Mesvir1/25697/Mv01893-RA.1
MNCLGNGVVGILREGKSKWERRAPLTPSHCARLLRGSSEGGHAIKRILVQPSSKRIYPDDAWLEAGCELSEDLSPCGLIMAVKQPPLGSLLPDRAYSFFSHTMKAQPENMALLDELLAKRVRLFDYECIVDAASYKRLVAFGEFAGRAGMIDVLRGLGERLLSLGYSTPFLNLGSTYMYPSLSAAKGAIIAVGAEIERQGLPASISPLIFTFTSTGNVSKGAQEVFRLLPHAYLQPSELPGFLESCASDPNNDIYRRQVYCTVLTAKDMVEPIEPGATFNKDHYYTRPDAYRPVFHKTVAPYASIIVNCMYWEPQFPRLLTKGQIKELFKGAAASTKQSPPQQPHQQEAFQRQQPRLMGVADISCDMSGSLEFVNRTTTIEKPFFRYNPVSDTYHEDMDGPGIFVLAVDILPSELAMEATKHFGDALMRFIVPMATCKDLTADRVPQEVLWCCITNGGSLMPTYEYITSLRGMRAKMEQEQAQMMESLNYPFQITVSLSGHLYDQFLINEALDIIERHGALFQLVSWDLGQTRQDVSTAALVVFAPTREVLDAVLDGLSHLQPKTSEAKQMAGPLRRRSSQLIQEAHLVAAGRDEAVPAESDQRPGAAPSNVRRVLLVGSGRMCWPILDYLSRCELPLEKGGHAAVDTTVGSNLMQEAQALIANIPRTRAVELDATNPDELRRHIAEADVVLSMLPATMHVPVARVCVELRRHLVTASYISADMQALHDQAVAAGVALLCEAGLDPGIDHMSAMKIIDEVHAAGGKILSFVSMCGGLPAPADADNPLGYKFSWFPRGVLSAGRAPAKYRLDGSVVEVKGEDLYSAAVPVHSLASRFPAFSMEQLPNRDSMSYASTYGIEEADTVMRCTLRYRGYSAIMGALAVLGYMEDQRPVSEILPSHVTTCEGKPAATYRALTQALAHPGGDFSSWRSLPEHEQRRRTLALVTDKLSASKAGTHEERARGLEAIRWLGLVEDTPLPAGCPTPMDVLCSLLESKLKYMPGQQDMVMLRHELIVELPGGAPTSAARTVARGEPPAGAADASNGETNGTMSALPDGPVGAGEAIAVPERTSLATHPASVQSVNQAALAHSMHPPTSVAASSPQQTMQRMRLSSTLLAFGDAGDGLSSASAVTSGSSSAVATGQPLGAVKEDKKDDGHHGIEGDVHSAKRVGMAQQVDAPCGTSHGNKGSGQQPRPVSAMARTVGYPVAVMAKLLLSDRIAARGVLRPTTQEIYMPALQELEALGIKCLEAVEEL